MRNDDLNFMFTGYEYTFCTPCHTIPYSNIYTTLHCTALHYSSFHVIISPKGKEASIPKLKGATRTRPRPRTRTRNANLNKTTNSSLKRTNGCSKGETSVVFVHKRSARELKIALEKAGFLDRSYRMVKADPNAIYTADTDIGTDSATATDAGADVKRDATSHIAVPVNHDCLSIISKEDRDNSTYISKYPWIVLIEGNGKQNMPFSTVVLGRK